MADLVRRATDSLSPSQKAFLAISLVPSLLCALEDWLLSSNIRSSDRDFEISTSISSQEIMTLLQCVLESVSRAAPPDPIHYFCELVEHDIDDKQSDGIGLLIPLAKRLKALGKPSSRTNRGIECQPDARRGARARGSCGFSLVFAGNQESADHVPRSFLRASRRLSGTLYVIEASVETASNNAASTSIITCAAEREHGSANYSRLRSSATIDASQTCFVDASEEREPPGLLRVRLYEPTSSTYLETACFLESLALQDRRRQVAAALNHLVVVECGEGQAALLRLTDPSSHTSDRQVESLSRQTHPVMSEVVLVAEANSISKTSGHAATPGLPSHHLPRHRHRRRHFPVRLVCGLTSSDSGPHSRGHPLLVVHAEASSWEEWRREQSQERRVRSCETRDMPESKDCERSKSIETESESKSQDVATNYDCESKQSESKDCEWKDDSPLSGDQSPRARDVDHISLRARCEAVLFLPAPIMNCLPQDELFRISDLLRPPPPPLPLDATRDVSLAATPEACAKHSSCETASRSSSCEIQSNKSHSMDEANSTSQRLELQNSLRNILTGLRIVLEPPEQQQQQLGEKGASGDKRTSSSPAEILESTAAPRRWRLWHQQKDAHAKVSSLSRRVLKARALDAAVSAVFGEVPATT